MLAGVGEAFVAGHVPRPVREALRHCGQLSAGDDGGLGVEDGLSGVAGAGFSAGAFASDTFDADAGGGDGRSAGTGPSSIIDTINAISTKRLLRPPRAQCRLRREPR